MEKLIDTEIVDKQEIIRRASIKYGEFLNELGFDWQSNPNMAETPTRVAKMMVQDICKGLFTDEPKITVFENLDVYDGMVFQGNIDVKSLCSHHFLPFFGKAFLAYIPGPSNKILGLSKLNRIVDYFSRRPQVQENLTMQIHNYLEELLVDSLGIAVVIEAQHTCVSHRGIGQESTMKTSKLSGVFMDNDNISRQEFYNFINDLKHR